MRVSQRTFRPIAAAIVAALGLFGITAPASAFCGFYVAKAGTDLFNEASKVVIARDEQRTVITMANDYQGELSEFAIVIPVPVVLEEDQIRVRENALIDHLDSYSSPRLVEYFDEDPCWSMIMEAPMAMDGAVPSEPETLQRRAEALGVTIEAEYSIGEYEILILSAEQSDGLQIWLGENGYQVPPGAADVLQTYILKGMKFFVAQVDLEAQAELGYTYLRPIQIEFKSEAFMLPIRLGMINANGPQELFVFALTQKGRTEVVNYQTVNLPTGMDVPLYVADTFGDFYKSMFNRAATQNQMRAVFLEYAWDMAWCDPCAADPLSVGQLRDLGVFWIKDADDSSMARDVYLTRLHFRYTPETFHDDIRFEVTDNRENFQGRFVLRHPWSGQAECREAEYYLQSLPERFENEAQTLARLTGWPIDQVRRDMANNGQDIDQFDPGKNK